MRLAVIGEVDRSIDPFITADYSPWELTPYAPVNIALVTQIMMERTATADGTSPVLVAFLASSTPTPEASDNSNATTLPVETSTPSQTPAVAVDTATVPTETATVATASATSTGESSPSPTSSPPALATQTLIPPPVASFTASPDNGLAPLNVTFTNFSTGNITAYTWDFGNGQTSSSVNPVQVYSLPGIYTVTLTVTGPGGSSTATRVITVTSLPATTVISPTQTATLPIAPTVTPVVPTQTATDTVVPPTSTPLIPTATPIEPTQTPTDTVVPPTSTPLIPTATPIEPTQTPTDTDVPPTSTPTATPAPQVDLSVAKTVNNGNPFEGDTVTFTVTITNNSVDTATAITVSDVLPSTFTYVSHNASVGTYELGTGSWTIPSLSNTAPATLLLNAQVNVGTAGQPLTNTARLLSSIPTDINPANDSASANVDVQMRLQADLAITKILDNPGPAEGDTITFTLEVRNNGPDAATGVQVEDVLPGALTYISASGGTYNNNIWTIDNLPAGANAQLIITATVNPGTAGQRFTNTATILPGSWADPVNTNNSASVNFRVRSNCPANGEPNIGPANGVYCEIQPPELIVDLGASPIVTGIGYDFVYYEISTLGAPGVVNVDQVIIEVGTSATGPWLEVFNWGDGIVDTNSNIGAAGYGSGGEPENTSIPATNPPFYGTAPYITGIAIDVDARVEPGTYRYVRLRVPDGTGIDALQPLAAPPLQADLAVSKTVNNDRPITGSMVTFEVIVTNNGASTATGVEVTDLLSGDFRYESHTTSVPTHTYNKDTGRWNIGTLANGAQVRLTINATVVATAGAPISNLAKITARNQADPNAGNDEATVNLVVQPPPSADLAITKTTNSPLPYSNSTVAFTISVRNNGPNDATGVRVADKLPRGLTYTSHSPGTFSYDDQSGVWNIGALANGATITLTINATVNGDELGNTITNRAEITASDQTDSNPANNSASVDLSVPLNCPSNGEPNIGPANGIYCVVDRQIVLDLGANPVITGMGYDLVYYEIPVYENPTVIHLDLVRVEVGTTATGPWLTVFNWGDGVVDTNTNIGAAGYGSSGEINDAVIPMTNPPLYGTAPYVTGIAIDVDARVAAGTYRYVRLRYPTRQAIDAVQALSVPPLQADLAVSKTVNNANPAEGSSITYEIVVQNNGASNATGVQVTDDLPDELTYVSHTANPDTYNHTSGLWDIGNLPVGTQATLRINTTVNMGTAGTIINNTAAITARNQADPNASNDTDNAAITVAPTCISTGSGLRGDYFRDQNLTDYALSRIDPTIDFFFDGNSTSFDIAPGVPATGVSARWTGQMETCYSETYTIVIPHDDGLRVWINDVLVWNVWGDGIHDTSIFNHTFTAGVFYNIRMEWYSNTFLPSQLRLQWQSASQPLQLIPAANLYPAPLPSANLQLDKSASPTTVTVGDTFNYTFDVINNGPSTAYNVVISDTLPAQVSFVSSPQCTASGNSLTCPVGTIASGGSSGGVVVTVRADSPGNPVFNAATVSSPIPDGDTTNNTASANVVINPPPTTDLSISKVIIAGATPNEGEQVVYRITVGNNGPTNATNVRVEDGLPDGLAYVSHSPSGFAYDPVSGEWNVGDVVVGVPIALEITAAVNAGTAGQQITNTARIIASTPSDSNSGNDSAISTLSVKAVDLAIAKEVNVTSANEGDTVQYILRVTNNGPDIATGIQVYDRLPDTLTYVQASGQYDQGSSLWIVEDLPPNTSAALTIDAIINGGTGGGNISNTATLSAVTEKDTNTANDSATTQFSVNPLPAQTDLIVRNLNPSTLQLGAGAVNITMEVGNAGPSTASNTQITFTLPASVVITGHGCVELILEGSTYRCRLGDLIAGQFNNAQFTMEVQTGETATIIFTGTTDQTDANTANNSVTLSINS